MTEEETPEDERRGVRRVVAMVTSTRWARATAAGGVWLALACGGGTTDGTADGTSSEPDDDILAGTLDAKVDALGICVGEVGKRKCGLIDREGRWILEPVLASVPSHPGVVATVAWDDINDHAILDRTGAKVALRRTAQDGDFTEWAGDRAGFQTEPKGKKRLIGPDGTAVSDVEVTHFGKPFQEASDRIAACAEDHACGYLDRTGQCALKPVWMSVEAFAEGRACVKPVDAERGGALVRPDGAFVAEGLAACHGASEGLVWMQRDPTRWGDDFEPSDGWAVIDLEGATVFEMPDVRQARPFSGGRAVIETGDGWALVAADGTLHRPAIAAKQIGGVSDGRALFVPEGGDRFGYLDAEGRVAIEATYPVPPKASGFDLAQFRHERAVVQDPSGTGMWGVLDTSRAWVVAPTLTALEPFADGTAYAKDASGAWFHLATDGREIRPVAP